MFKQTLLACSLLASWVAGAEEVLNFNASKRSCVAHSGSTWGYYGQLSQPQSDARRNILLPNNWGLRYAACGRSLAPLHRQSPIELPAAEAVPSGEKEGIRFGGNAHARVIVEHNCHTVQSTLTDESVRTMTLAGQEYRLLQFHIHTPSEHVIDGGEAGTSNYPAEIHFVHAAINRDGSIDGGQLAVVGLFVDVAPSAPLPKIDEFFSNMARDYQGVATTPGQPITVNLNQLTRGGSKYWRYQGSLTTPPCSETVEWLVIEEPLVISGKTYEAIQTAKLDVGIANARPPALPTPEHKLRHSAR